MADPNLTYPLHLPALNKAIASRVLEVRGSDSIVVKRVGDSVTLSVPQTPRGAVGAMIFVNLTKTTGSIGTQTTTSSWVYTANNLTGTQLGTGLSPLSETRRNGAWTQATHGTGYFNTSGTFVLVQAFEGIPTGTC